MLESAGVLAGARVWDLFAGSGALGIEALSRGAARATFVDQARSAVSAARANLAKLGYGPDRAKVVCGDALTWAQARGLEHSWGEADAGETLEEVDLVLADPPYAWQEWAALLSELARYSPLCAHGDGRRARAAPGLASAAVQALRRYPRYIGPFAR